MLVCPRIIQKEAEERRDAPHLVSQGRSHALRSRSLCETRGRSFDVCRAGFDKPSCRSFASSNPSQLFRHPEGLKLFHRRELMLFSWVRIPQHHLNPRVPEHRRERNQINASHRRACRPSVTKIVESKVWNRTLACFRSDAVDSRQRANVRTIYFDDWLVGRSTGKNKIAFYLLKPSSQDRTGLLSERDFASGCFCLSERVEEIALVEMNVLAANAANFIRPHSGFKHHRRDVS
jgi:hypothetical protein